MSEEKTNIGVGTITIPDGQELKELKVYCEKHGDVTKASVYINYSIGDKAAKKEIECKNIYCLACLNDLLTKFQQNGEIGKIALVPVIGDKE